MGKPDNSTAYQTLTLGKITVYIPKNANISSEGLEISISGKWLLKNLEVRGLYR